jgi:hypothetical protein
VAGETPSLTAGLFGRKRDTAAGPARGTPVTHGGGAAWCGFLVHCAQPDGALPSALHIRSGRSPKSPATVHTDTETHLTDLQQAFL